MFRLWESNAGCAEESQWAYNAYAGGDFLDIGSFHGWYAFLLAPKANPGDTFLCFEPDPRSFPELSRNLGVLADLFPELRLWPVPSPAGTGTAASVSYPLGTRGHPRFASVPAVTAETSTISVDSLVRVLGLRPTAVKIDVEGAEHLVLLGMRETLANFRPALMLEVHPEWQPKETDREEISQLLTRHGYACVENQPGSYAVRQLWTWRGDSGREAL